MNLALAAIQVQVSALVQKSPLRIDNDVNNYIDSLELTSGTSGTSGVTGNSGTSGTCYGNSGTSGNSEQWNIKYR
jgi:ABC-type microcin C transport system duplicated ATPase subunit YejF